MRHLLRLTVLTSVLCCLGAAPSPAVKQATPEAVQWFQDAKFGLFIHWGVYALEGRGEWVMNTEKIPIADYEKLPPRFNPVKFDPAAWVAMAKQAGVRYITITTKHHDGFAMFDSKVSDYNIVARTPYKRDVIKMLSDECQKQGLKLFLYYSHLDWHHPDYARSDPAEQKEGQAAAWERYKAYYMAQVDELCSGRYGKIGGIWFDGWWNRPKFDWGLAECYDRIHAAQPQAMVGNNHHVKPFPGEDFQMFEQDLPGANTSGFNKALVAEMPLETCMTINHSWGYNAQDKDFKSAKQCLHNLIKAAGRGANLLLNVGPKPDGTIQPEAVQHLAEMGAWLANHGEAIYGTRRGPYAPADWGVSTIKGQRTVYLHVLDVPKDGNLSLPAPPDGITSVTTLGGTPLPDAQIKGGTLLIPIPQTIREDVDTILVITLAERS